MSLPDSKTIARQYFEFINQRNFDALQSIIAEDFTDRTAMPGQASGFEGLREFFDMFLAAFPDLQATVDDLIAEGDKVVARFSVEATHQGELMGIPATGKRVQFGGIDIFRISQGKIVELWDKEDLLGLMQQIGAFES